jgi:hypothetical protein
MEARNVVWDAAAGVLQEGAYAGRDQQPGDQRPQERRQQAETRTVKRVGVLHRVRVVGHRSAILAVVLGILALQLAWVGGLLYGLLRLVG